MNDPIKNHPALADYLDRADHVDVKTAQGPVDLRGFIAAMFGRKPAWATFLFRLRGWLARLFGLRHPEETAAAALRPEDVSFEPGRPAAFFTVAGGPGKRLVVGRSRRQAPGRLDRRGGRAARRPGQSVPCGYHRSLQSLDRAGLFQPDPAVPSSDRRSNGPVRGAGSGRRGSMMRTGFRPRPPMAGGYFSGMVSNMAAISSVGGANPNPLILLMKILI